MFDFIFKNGEFLPDDSSFWQGLLTSAIGAGVGAGGALFVYWLQIQRERDMKSVTQYAKNTADINYFKLVLNDAITFVNVQSKIKKKYAEEIKNAPYKSHLLNSYPTLPLVRLEKINHEKTHELFITTQGEGATRKFKEIYKYVDFFSESFSVIDETLEKDTNEVQNMKHDYIKKFADLIDNASKKANSIKYNTYDDNPLYKTDTLFCLIDKIIADFHENRKDTTDLEYHQIQFVRKLNEGIVLDGFLQDADCLNLALGSKVLTHLYSDIKFKTESLADYLERYVEAIDKEFGNFTSSVDIIVINEQVINRHWYHIFYNPDQ